MRRLFICLLAAIGLFSSCSKKAKVAQSELNGTWKKKFSLSAQDKIIIANDSVLTWHNYRNTFSTKTFTIKYFIDKSRMTLYRNGCRYDQIDVLKNNQGKLLFNVYEQTVFDESGASTNQTATYQKE